MGEAQYQILGAMLGYLLAQLIRYLGKQRFWRAVAAEAERNLADPAVPVNTPIDAAERALVSAQREKVVSVARGLKSIPPPFVTRKPSNLIDRPFDRDTGRDERDEDAIKRAEKPTPRTIPLRPQTKPGDDE